MVALAVVLAVLAAPTSVVSPGTPALLAAPASPGTSGTTAGSAAPASPSPSPSPSATAPSLAMHGSPATPGLSAGPGTLPAGATVPLPGCSRGDVTTPLSSFASWASVILDTRLALPPSYTPPDLVSVGSMGASPGQRLRRFVLPDLRAMVAAARAAGVRIGVGSGYRSYADQVRLYRSMVAMLGARAARLRVALPGHSEHQLGTAFDLADASSDAWASAHGWQFGWIVSYPKGMTGVTCYQAEPWHLRYVGRAEAARVHASGLVLRAWLWLGVPAARAAGTPLGSSHGRGYTAQRLRAILARGFSIPD
jgi:D-alanyl-D-alanine carboxypeptidase